MMLRLLAVACASLVATATAATAPLADALRHCAQDSDDKQRLACFDELAKSVPASKVDEFGMTAMIAHERAPTAPFLPKQQDALAASITALREGPRGALVFTLDNGQVWQQAEPQSHLHFSAGESIEIQHGAMGSLWLAASKGRKTRVTRLH